MGAERYSKAWPTLRPLTVHFLWLSAFSLLRFPINLGGTDKVEGSALNGFGFLASCSLAPE